HHLIDVAGPEETYSAARYAADAAHAISDVAARGRLPILAGGTGFYYRALVRGLFPGPPRDDAIRARLDRVAALRGAERLYRWVGRLARESPGRFQPRVRRRLVRALEFYLPPGRPLPPFFSDTAAPTRDLGVLPIGLTLPREALWRRVANRVESQFARG